MSVRACVYGIKERFKGTVFFSQHRCMDQRFGHVIGHSSQEWEISYLRGACRMCKWSGGV